MGSMISVPVLLESDARGALNVATAPWPEVVHPLRVPVLGDMAPQVPEDLRSHHATHRATSLEQTGQAVRLQVIMAQEAERQRIARDLHDEAGHALTAAVLRLDLEMMRFAGDAPAIEALQRVRRQLVDCSGVLHTIAFNLRPRILEDLGLHAALRSLGAHTMELTDLEVTVAISGSAWALDEIVELMILRVVQEALTNVRKHAQASRVRVTLRYMERGLTLRIVDDGIGVDPRAAIRRAQAGRIPLGISGMRERIELLGGSFSIKRGQAGGTRVTARLPR